MMMKLRVTPRNLPSSTNRNRVILSHTLLPKCSYSILQSKTHLSRRKLRMTPTNTTLKWGVIILRMHLHAHRTKFILRIIQLHTHVINRCSIFIPHYSNSIYRICITLRTDIILRSNCNYNPPIRNPICRNRSSPISVRKIRSR